MEVELGMKETTMKIKNNPLRWLALCTTLALLVACSSTKSVNHAPVEDRGTAVGSRPAPAVVSSVTDPVKPPPGIENAGKPGYYTIKSGDTLIRIGLENGQSWRDLVRWNALDNPNRIEVGQVIRIVPPGVVPPAVTASASTAPGVIVGTPMPPAPAPAPGVVSGAAKAVAPTAPAATPTVTVSATATDEEIAWIWPVSGAVLVGFDDVKNKGLDLNGKAGDPVSAVADGRVVYSGAGLRGYGNLIILKHNNTYLTAYAHNQTLLVKEDQSVRKGQKIAEMGSSDADRVKLHFEIRRQGKPVDPAKYLPAR